MTTETEALAQQVADLLIADPICGGRVTIDTVNAIAALRATSQPVGDDTVAFVQEWMMSGDHEADQWHKDFAAAIDARSNAFGSDQAVKYMVDRFLSWKLPADFNPDGGITLKNVSGQNWPVGTNLLTAAQAEEMIRHIMGGAALSTPTPTDAVGLLEAERIAKSAVIILAALEEHCRNKLGLKGIDHADEGQRIRRGIQAFLADPSIAALTPSPVAEGRG